MILKSKQYENKKTKYIPLDIKSFISKSTTGIENNELEYQRLFTVVNIDEKLIIFESSLN